jgi:prepilin-type N-terminal cleavage/methylation domain-containing protein
VRKPGPVVRGNAVENQMPHAVGRRAAEPSAPAGRIHRDARGGFTLVELLAAIVIVALLTAVAVPVVMQALAKARNTAIKAEIDMLHMAIMNYKNEYGSFPPCVDRLYRGPDGSALQNRYLPDGEADKHLKRLFPRCNAVDQLNAATNLQYSRENRTPADTVWLSFFFPPPGSPPSNVDLHLNPHTALVSWLGGYSSNPAQPLTGGSRKKLFDFEQGRISTDPLTLNFYTPSGKRNAPYIYIDSAHYALFSPYPGLSPTVPHVEYMPDGITPFNKDTFQIICAGRDETYGTDDDLSNFWPGTRKEYLDSL